MDQHQPLEINDLRILILEDVPSDAELVKCELRDAGLAYTSLRVDTRVAFEQALDEFKPDIVLADYNLPSYNGREALEYTRRTHPHIPVIIVTGSLGDEAAVELLKLGARDYVLKGGLPRLSPAIKRALSEEESIRNRKIAEGKYKVLFSEAMDGIVLIACETWQIADCNPEFERQTGRTLEQLKKLKIWEVLPPKQHELARQSLLEIQKVGNGRGTDFTIQKTGGEIGPFEFSAKYVNIQQQSFIQCIIRDTSERLLAEARLRASDEKHRLLFESSRDALMTLAPPSWKFTGANTATLQLFGASSVAEFTALGPWDVSPVLQTDGRPSAEKAQEMIATAMREGSLFFEWEHQRIDGSPFAADVLLTRMEMGEKVFVQATVRDISERKRTEVALRRANRALKTLSAGNLALVRAANEDELLRSVTSVIAEQGGYSMAMVGYAENDPAKSLSPMAWTGMNESHFWMQHPVWADTEEGQIPIARAIRSGTMQICHDIANGTESKPWRDAALARGYVSNIALPLSDDNKTFGGLSIYSSEADAFDEQEVRLLEELANDLAYGILTLRTRIKHEQQAAILRQSLEQSIQTIAGVLEARDPYTAGHQRRVAELATAIAREMGLPYEQVEGVYFAAIVHDLGKIHIPSEILSKPGKLTDIEYLLIKTHSQAGYDILKDVKFPWPIADIVLQHHEKLDGSGYPQGLRGGQILLEARILTVADVVEAMSSHRPYRPALGVEATLQEIERGRGSVYDPAVADACLRLFAKKGFSFSN